MTMTTQWTLEELDGIAPTDLVHVLTEYEQRIAELTAELAQARANLKIHGEATMEKLQSITASGFAEWEAENKALEAENARLRAALDAAQEWQPVADEQELMRVGALITYYGAHVFPRLDTNYAICRRAPAQDLRPHPDWSGVPDNMIWWCMAQNGMEYYSAHEPRLWGMSWTMPVYQVQHTREVPLGVDWRTLKERRALAQEGTP